MISLDSQTPKFGKSLVFAQSVLSTHGWLFAGREYSDLLPELLPKKKLLFYIYFLPVFVNSLKFARRKLVFPLF